MVSLVMWHDVAGRASITWWNSLVQSFPERPWTETIWEALNPSPWGRSPQSIHQQVSRQGQRQGADAAQIRLRSSQLAPLGVSEHGVYHPRTIETSDMTINYDKPIGTHIFWAVAHFWAFPYNAQAVFLNPCCFPFIKSFEHWSLEGAMPVGWVKSFWTQACLSVYSIPPKTIQCTWFMIHLISSYIIVYSSLHSSAYHGMSQHWGTQKIEGKH